PPIGGRRYSSYSPVLSERYAIHFPSDDHAGLSSCTLELSVVSVRTLPCSVGTVKTLPRASSNARVPEGESAKLPTFCDTFLNAGRASKSSACTWIGMFLAFPFWRLNSYNR